MTKYLHVNFYSRQTCYGFGKTCGDVIKHYRAPHYTLSILCDGLGHGLMANIAAEMCSSRLLEMIKGGFSLREAFTNVVKTMHQIRGKKRTYAVFSVVKIMNDGKTTILTYEIPAPILIGRKHASVLKQRTMFMETEMIGESNCFLEPGEGILVVSDGVSQSGLGGEFRFGWGIEGVCDYLNSTLMKRHYPEELPLEIVKRSIELSNNFPGDDTTALLNYCRRGKVVNIFTGPPVQKENDGKVVNEFRRMSGTSVVCGATTAEIVSKILGREITVQQEFENAITPPHYYIEGIDLVTEGAITLNQVYRLLDEDEEIFGYPEPETGVDRLGLLLREADRVNFIVGRASNPAHKDITFKQQGIIQRKTIVLHIKEKLEKLGKLVVVNYV